MEQAEIDAIIRNKRKARDPKACYACHRRKVKVSTVPVFVLAGARNDLMHFPCCKSCPGVKKLLLIIFALPSAIVIFHATAV